MQVDERRCSFARRCCGGDLQLEVGARLMPVTARLRSCPGHVSSRSEAPWHASADAHSSCVPSATVCLLVCAHLDECRVPSPAALIGPSPSHLGGCLRSAGRIGGGEAWRFQAGDALCVPRLAPQRRFAAYLERAHGIAERRRMAVSGPWRPHLCVYCWA